MSKRILSFLLVVALLLSAIPLVSFTANAYADTYPLPTLTGDQAVDTVNIALSQLGYAEDSSGGTAYGAWWTSFTNWGVDYTNLAWCAMFACWCANQAGAGYNVAYDKNGAQVTSLLSWLKNNATADTSFSTTPVAGDFIFFENGSSHHVAIVIEYDSSTNKVTFVGGNQSNKVTKSTVTWSSSAKWGSQYVVGYGRPNYSRTTPEKSVYFGIDVSHHQGTIDWDTVKPQIDFAILRCGYGSDMTSQDDRQWKANADACTRLGIPFGVYIYSYATTDAQALSEAEHVLRLVQGYDPTLPIYLDLEDSSILDSCSKADILRHTQIFCDKIESAGYEVGVYANYNWWTNYLTASEYDNWDRWIARYASATGYSKHYSTWQYTSSGSIDGISGNVDLNYRYKPIPGTGSGAGEDHTCTRGSLSYTESAHPHYNWYICSLCGEEWKDTSATTPLSTCDACRPGKPILTYSANSESCESATITFAWNKTSNTTHYNLWLDKKTADGGWEKVENVFYAESGLARTLAEGEYRAQLLSYNSNMWEPDDSDWVHTWAENVYFTVGHDYKLTIIPATCTEYALNLYTCSVCGDSYSEYEDSIYSEWSTTYPQGIDASIIETKTQWRYSDYETKTTDSSNMTGWTLLKSDWEESETGTVDYVSSWPSGFSTGHSLYSTYHNAPKTATENSTTKIKPGSTSACGYIYWHWCRGDYTAGPINRKTSQTQTGEFDTFHAFYSTTAPSSLGTPASDGSYVYSNGSCCTDTYWYYPITVYRQNYTVYSKMYTYYRWTEWSEWSDKEYHESETRNVEERTVYRYIAAPLGGHSWDNGVITTPPTEEAEGVKTYTCTACGATKTESIPVLEHSHSYVATVTAPTCTEQGYTTYTCTCGDSFKENFVDALGHNASGWIVDLAPTCTVAGSMHTECTRCGALLQTSAIQPSGHTESDWIVDKEATCTEGGAKHKECTVCKLRLQTEAIPALGHDYASVVTEPTCTEAGYTTYTCETCGHSYTGDAVPATGHDYEDGSCIHCGAEDPDWTEPEDPFVNPFIDVKENDYFYDPVLWAVQKGITNGTTPTTFSPYDPCTRGQIVTFLWRAFGSPEPERDENPFTDVPENMYYYKAILWAVEQGITTGTSATTFSPEDTCTRGQVATFLWRACGKPAPEGSENPFTDVPETVYYYEPILWAVENGITNGTGNGKFSPEDSCTRGQIVTFLYRALAK